MTIVLKQTIYILRHADSMIIKSYIARIGRIYYYVSINQRLVKLNKQTHSDKENLYKRISESSVKEIVKNKIDSLSIKELLTINNLITEHYA